MLTLPDESRLPAPPAGRFVIGIGLLGVLTVAAAFVGHGDPWIALVPCMVGVPLYAFWHLPLRAALLTLLVFAWALEVPGDGFANGLVHTPWRHVGAVLFAKLNLSVPVDALILSGFDLLVFFFLTAIVYRHYTRSRLDRVGWVAPPSPLTHSVLISLLAVAAMAGYGLMRGGDFKMALWQITKHLYLPVLYLLMAYSLRGAADVGTIGRLVLGVAVFRAAEAILFRRLIPSYEALPHATTHHDSVLFALAVTILFAMLLERPGPRTYRICAVLAPIYLYAMVANNRRLVWVEVAFTAIFFFLIAPMGKVKRLVLRAIVISILPLLLYGRIGWNSDGGRVFAPVRTVRSLFDAKRDSSTRWREWENYDLVFTFKHSPLVGSGFGHPYIETVKLPDVTKVYPLEPYVPHNSVLGLWAFGGILGFGLLWMMYPVGMFFTVRAYRWAANPTERIAALGAAAAQICYLMQAYGDLGFGTWGPVFTLAASYAVVGKICVANGAWTLSPGSAAEDLRTAVRTGSRVAPEVV